MPLDVNMTNRTGRLDYGALSGLCRTDTLSQGVALGCIFVARSGLPR